MLQYFMEKRYAFTLLEMIFVIVVIAIISIFMIKKEDSKTLLTKAALQIVSDIRYTQHLALSEDHYKPGDTNWYKKRWTLIFNSDHYSDDEIAYTIFSDRAGKSRGNPDVANEVAKDPLNPKRYLSGGFTGVKELDIRKPEEFQGLRRYNIGKQYGIKEVKFSKSCSYYSSKRIEFDAFGRLLRGKLSNYTTPYPKRRVVTSQCKITLTDKKGNEMSILIEPETGFVKISTI